MYVGLPVVDTATTTGPLVEGKEENPLTEVVVILSGSKFMICMIHNQKKGSKKRAPSGYRLSIVIILLGDKKEGRSDVARREEEGCSKKKGRRM